jgi:PAP_fibrillin
MPPPSLASNSTTRSITLLLCFVFLNVRCSTALQNLIPPQWKFPTLGTGGRMDISTNSKTAMKLENEILEAIANVDNRLSNDERIESLIAQLEETKSIPGPAIAPQIYGTWRLLYTTAATTSSPIQRRAVNAQQFPIYQDIVIVPSDRSGAVANDDSDNNPQQQLQDRLVVKQIVKFTDTISLSVDALASTAAYPLDELQPRQGSGKILGMNLLGVSLVGDEAQPDTVNRPNSRIDFVFDEGNFYIGDQWKIPYPVPFRLPILRDAVKGWIDITYLSDRIRISRGNKGTTFVLLKETEQ